MEPLAYYPSSKLDISGLEPIFTSINKATGAVACGYSDRFPASIVGISWRSVGAEGECIDVELEVCVIKKGARTSRCEDWVGQTSPGVVGFDCKRSDERTILGMTTLLCHPLYFSRQPSVVCMVM